MIKKWNICTNLSQKCKLSKKGSPGEIWAGFRSSRSEMFVKISVFKNFANSTGKLCWRYFLIKLQSWRLCLKETSTQVFSCEICKNFKNTFFYRAHCLLLMFNSYFQRDREQKPVLLSAINTRFSWKKVFTVTTYQNTGWEKKNVFVIFVLQ